MFLCRESWSNSLSVKSRTKLSSTAFVPNIFHLADDSMHVISHQQHSTRRVVYHRSPQQSSAFPYLTLEKREIPVLVALGGVFGNLLRSTQLEIRFETEHRPFYIELSHYIFWAIPKPPPVQTDPLHRVSPLSLSADTQCGQRDYTA